MRPFFKGVRAGIPIGLVVSAAMGLTLAVLIFAGRVIG